MGRLTTHVLDTTLGKPAAGLAIELWRMDGEPRQVTKAVTNGDGRVDAPLLTGESFVSGTYELRFAAGAYLRRAGNALSDPPFLDVIPIRFGLAGGEAHYHVPLLLSAHGYATYRGS